MIVVDASAILELLLNTPAAERVARRISDPAESLHAPYLIDLEVAQVLRRYDLAGDMKGGRGAEALKALFDLPLTRYPHEALLPRIWELRHNLTAYDACYIALAELLDAPLLTADHRMASARGHSATIERV